MKSFFKTKIFITKCCEMVYDEIVKVLFLLKKYELKILENLFLKKGKKPEK